MCYIRHPVVNPDHSTATTFGDLLMSDVEALKAEKNSLIAEMLELQKQFIDREHDGGISGKDYYYSQEGLLKDYRQKYMEKAMRVVELSHQIVGSKA
jgi:hypothetical protein